MNLADSASRARRDPAIEERAADWLLRSRDDLSSGERAALQRWLAADSRHAAAYAEMDETWRTLNAPRATGLAAEFGRELETRRQRRAARRRATAWAGAGLAAAAAFVFFLVPADLPKSSPAPMPALATVAVRPDRLVLPDGSTVELNSGAQIAVEFTAAKRSVTLQAGEAIFSVQKDPARPFVVVAGGVEVRAVGTVFSVRHAEGRVGVLVTEGRVAVDRAAGAGAPVAVEAPPVSPLAFIEAGARLIVPADLPAATPLEIKPITPREVAAALAWRGKRMEFSGTPMAEAVELFNRQNRLQLAVPDVVLARHQLSGIFWADDPEGFVRLLESGMNVTPERTGDTITLRRK
jgi:transmembrane sensor